MNSELIFYDEDDYELNENDLAEYWPDDVEYFLGNFDWDESWDWNLNRKIYYSEINNFIDGKPSLADQLIPNLVIRNIIRQSSDWVNDGDWEAGYFDYWWFSCHEGLRLWYEHMDVIPLYDNGD